MAHGAICRANHLLSPILRPCKSVLQSAMTNSSQNPARIVPPRRNRRLAWIVLIGLLLVTGVGLILTALNENTQFFYNPYDVVQADFVPASDPFRIGGLVVEGSVEKGTGLTTRFAIKDFEREMSAPIQVTYTGVLPDLFRDCLLYTSPSPRDGLLSRMPSSA